tara:strand:- start:283 stop:402 length:120 start_codon:yes stop_codon:yes gene_type:complete
VLKYYEIKANDKRDILKALGNKKCIYEDGLKYVVFEFAL